MQTIRLRINNKVYNHLLWFLRRFTKEEIQVIEETDQFVSVQEYLSKELQRIEDGNANFMSIDDLDDELESIIKEYET